MTNAPKYYDLRNLKILTQRSLFMDPIGRLGNLFLHLIRVVNNTFQYIASLRILCTKHIMNNSIK